MVNPTLRRKLLASTIVAGTLIAAPAFAQTPAPADESDTIVVTGTLIANPNLTSSSPVTAVGTEEIQLRQSATAEQILREIPGVIPGNGQQVNNGQSSSGSTLNLRGLGSNRNIILLDGSRTVPANFNGTVDLNNIPLALVDRVDVLTGGASTTYGADAIAGVVNFITKRDFAGFEARIANGITEKGDGNAFRTDFTIGANFDDGRGNAVLGIGYIETDPIYQGDRDVSIFGISSTSGVASGSSFTSTPTALSSTIYNGQFGTTDIQVNAAGTAFVPFYNGFNFNPYNIFQTPYRRYNAYAAARYEISDTIEVYSRAMFSKNTTQQIIAPSGIFGTPQTINPTNPYLTGTLKTQICTANGFATIAACDAAPSLNLGGVYRRSVELGPRVSTYVTTVFDYQLGARFNITDSLKLDVYGAYGESENIETRSGYVSNSRVGQSLRATNTTNCLPPSDAACVPLNLFGAWTPAMSAYLGGITSAVANRASLAQAHAVLNGDFGYTLPSAADPISFAVGGEYRRYGAQRAPDSLAQVPGELGGAGGAVLPLNGGYDVYEAFGELIAPIAKDQPFFDELSLEAGIRYSKYRVETAAAPSFGATTYKLGLNWAPVSAVKLRANYQKAVRAPNIGELFAPVVTGLTSLLIDPCSGTKPVGNANLTAVCIAQGAPAASIGSIQDPSAGQANATAGGNPFILPEKADTFTVGVILRPEELIPNLTLSVDYYDIRVNNAITNATSSDVIGACFNNITAASATAAACTGIRRNAQNGRLSGTSTAANPILGLPTPLTNNGRLATAGIDFKLNWRHDFGAFKFVYDLNGNWTRTAQFRASPTGFNRECVGYFSANCSSQNGALQPAWSWTQRTTFSFQDIDLSVLWRHLSAMQYEGQAADFAARGFTATSRNLFNGTITGPTPLVGTTANFNRISSYDYFDLSARFNLTKELTLTLSSFNLFNRKPPVVGASAGTTGQNSGNTFPSTYDVLGRRYSATINLRF